MWYRRQSKLNPRGRYLQIALNSTLDEAYKIIDQLPASPKIILEAGTPLIKQYGASGLAEIRRYYEQHLNRLGALSEVMPYVVADLKTMDRGETEVDLAASAGASAAVALGSSPTETLNAFLGRCRYHGLDAMIDMMNVEYPLAVLRALKEIPLAVILHRGVDEERFNGEKMIPLHEIRRIKGNFDIMVSIAGGDTVREVQRSIFNDADIVVIWKTVYQSSDQTVEIVNEFLHEIR
jgi:bifunctional enzyme Fae/Hps